MLLKSIKFQFKLMMEKKGFRLAFSFMLMISLLPALYWAKWSIGQDITMVPAASQVFLLNFNSPLHSVLRLLYIFVLLLPFSFSFLNDKRSKEIELLQVRTGKKEYYISKGIVVFVGIFLAFFIPLVISIGINQIIFPSEGLQINGFVPYSYNHTASITGDNVMVNAASKAYPFAKLFVTHPQIYNLLYSGLFSAVSAIMGEFVYSLSFFVKKYNIVLFVPLFLLEQIENKVDILVEKYSKCYVNTKITDYITVQSYYGKSTAYFVGFCLFMLSISVLLHIYMIKKDSIE